MTTATTTQNGNGAAHTVELPVDSFREAAPLLRRPFTREAVKFKIQSSWQGGALIVAYIDARLVVERLNLVCPHLWTDETYTPVAGGKGLECALTIGGITHRDVGADYIGKGLYSDALKRAAVKFGIGVSLYALPKMILNDSDGHIKRKQKGQKEYVELTPSGESRARDIYALWLDTLGKQAFGDPLDHGDAPDAIGDAEVEAPAADPATGEVLAGSAEIEALRGAAKGLKFAQVKLAFASIGLPAPPTAAKAFDAVPQSQVLALGKALEGIER